ncbi:uncharacterized protein LOC117228461 [Megalopta genalis]|uniref:uncharacterized protein LOC117228461 n=1 Tax=Megalopta genalis TaxID=115081 RepID=UPI003FCF197C
MDEGVRTLWCGNLSEKVTEEILYELFLQGGPVQRVFIPKDRDGKQRTFGFITYKHINSVTYALNLFDGTKLFNRAICMSPRNNVDSPQKANTQDQYLNCNHLLQSGQQMLLRNGFPRIQLEMFGTNMLPNSGPHSKQIDTHAYHDNRRPSKVHPYRREQSKSNQRKDHRSRNTHNNHRSNDYTRRDYSSSSRRNYR